MVRVNYSNRLTTISQYFYVNSITPLNLATRSCDKFDVHAN